jgi:hypothetical protein
VTVISSDPDKYQDDSVSPDVIRREQITWAEMQEELAKLSSHGTHLVAKGSSHYVQLDRPDMVISAIHNLVKEYRSKPVEPPPIPLGNLALRGGCRSLR